MDSHRIQPTPLGLFFIIALFGCATAAEQPTAPTASVETTSPTRPESIQTTSSPDQSDESETVTAINEALTSFMGDEMGGVEVLVIQNGNPVSVVAGIGSAEGEDLPAGRPFRVGSISKPFVAVMVLQLVEEGRLDLDATLATYIPDAALGIDSTIRQLLSHRSGIANYTDQRSFFSDVLKDRSRQFSTDEILGYVDNNPGDKPGEFAYSNTNYILLGQLIEQLDGNDLNTSLQTRITEPTRLKSTSFETPLDQPADGLVGGWSKGTLDGDPNAPYESIASGAWSSGALISTTDDLATFLSALSGGQLVSASLLAEMTSFGSGGYGLGLAKVALSPTKLGYGHSGTIVGYTSTMAIDPQSGDTLIILTSNDALSADQLAPILLASVLS